MLVFQSPITSINICFDGLPNITICNREDLHVLWTHWPSMESMLGEAQSHSDLQFFPECKVLRHTNNFIVGHKLSYKCCGFKFIVGHEPWLCPKTIHFRFFHGGEPYYGLWHYPAVILSYNNFSTGVGNKVMLKYNTMSYQSVYLLIPNMESSLPIDSTAERCKIQDMDEATLL